MKKTMVAPQPWFVHKPIVMFAASRAIILMAILFSAAHIAPSPMPGTWNMGDRWWHWMLRWDAGYYEGIAQNGYSYDGNPVHFQTIVFFPGYPVLIRGLALISGLTLPVAAVVASNLCSLAAILLLFYLVKGLWGADTATAATAMLCFFPASLFLSAGYSEGTALLLTVAFFVFLLRGRFAPAAICAGCLSAVRPTGAVLAVPLVYEMWEHSKRRLSRRFWVWGAGAAATACSGLFAFSAYCWVRFNDPLLFIHARGAWALGGPTGPPGSVAWKQLAAGLNGLMWPNTSDPWVFLGAAAVLAAGWKRLPASMSVYSAAALLFLVITRILGPEGFVSSNRYLLLVFPCFVAAATFLAQRVWLSISIAAGMAVFLFMYSALFVQWYWAG